MEIHRKRFRCFGHTHRWPIATAGQFKSLISAWTPGKMFPYFPGLLGGVHASPLEVVSAKSRARGRIERVRVWGFVRMKHTGNLLVCVEHRRKSSGNVLKIGEPDILEEGCVRWNQRCQVPDDAMKKAARSAQTACTSTAGGCARTTAVEKHMLPCTATAHAWSMHTLSQGVSWMTRKICATIRRDPRWSVATPDLCHSKA